jgi:hypothetical protein
MIFAFILFPFIVLAFFDFSLLRTHFWPFTEVVRKIRREVTRRFVNFWEPADCADETDRSGANQTSDPLL